MTNEGMARNYMAQAQYRLEEVERAVQAGQWPIAVRRSQECVEQALKAALRFVGIEPPKWHDMRRVLEDNVNHFPAWFRQGVETLGQISARRREHRELSFYGDEAAGRTPGDLYGEEDARQALDDARLVCERCQRLVFPQEGVEVRRK